MRLCAMWALAHASRARDCALALPLIDECRAIVQQRDDAAAAQKRTGGGAASSSATTTDVEEAVPSVESLGYLQAMALLGMGDAAAAHRVLAPVVQSNPNHEMSAHLLTLVEQRVATAAVVSLGIVGAAAAVGAVVLGALASGRNARA
ncbi:mitochondrial fission 1 protein [Pseudoscourfieldia marina]